MSCDKTTRKQLFSLCKVHVFIFSITQENFRFVGEKKKITLKHIFGNNCDVYWRSKENICITFYLIDMPLDIFRVIKWELYKCFLNMLGIDTNTKTSSSSSSSHGFVIDRYFPVMFLLLLPQLTESLNDGLQSLTCI